MVWATNREGYAEVVIMLSNNPHFPWRCIYEYYVYIWRREYPLKDFLRVLICHAIRAAASVKNRK